MLSSYDGGSPRVATGLTVLPAAGPAAGTFGSMQPSLVGATAVSIP